MTTDKRTASYVLDRYEGESLKNSRYIGDDYAAALDIYADARRCDPFSRYKIRVVY